MRRGNKRFILVGDRVLVRPNTGEERTDHGLYLPQSAIDKQQVQWGRVVACGPGIPVPNASTFEDEPWKASEQEPRYFPLQARVGHTALFLRKTAIEVQFEGDPFLIVPHNAILALVAEDGPDDEELSD